MITPLMRAAKQSTFLVISGLLHFVYQNLDYADAASRLHLLLNPLFYKGLDTTQMKIIAL